jgi:hypothetical protein
VYKVNIVIWAWAISRFLSTACQGPAPCASCLRGANQMQRLAFWLPTYPFEQQPNEYLRTDQ